MKRSVVRLGVGVSGVCICFRSFSKDGSFGSIKTIVFHNIAIQSMAAARTSA
jgi:hypothetical protein